MYKIILLSIMILLITGCDYELTGNATVTCNKPYILVGADCCLDKDDNSICDKDEVNEEVDKLEEGNVVELPEEKEEEPVVREEVVKEEPEKLEQEKIVWMSEGDSVIFNGKNIALNKIDQTSGLLEYIVDIEGVIRSLYSTKKVEIVNGVKVSALKFDNLKQEIEVKFEIFELEPNEYLITTNKDVLISGREIHLRDVTEDEFILVDVIGGTLKTLIKEGSTKNIGWFEVGNVDAFFRDSLNERYAIINVTKVS